MLQDFGDAPALRFLEDLYSSTTHIERPDEVDEQSAIALIRKHAALNLSLCDALTAAIMLRLGIPTTFSRDRRDFAPMGFSVVPPHFF
jgi:predicted nucleic acid-binding protein